VVDVIGSSSSSLESPESNDEKKASESWKQVVVASTDMKNPFSTTKVVTPLKKTMFSVDTIKKADSVLNIESWLENTLNKKRKRTEEGTPSKDTLSSALQSGSIVTKIKKAKTLSILGKDPNTGHLTVEVAKPVKEGRIEDLSSNDFELQSIDLGEMRHDTKVDLWKSTTIVIEEELEELKMAKVSLKAEVKELNTFIRQMVSSISGAPVAVSSFDPSNAESQALLSKLQEDKCFGQIGKGWVDKIRSEGLMVIDQLGHAILKLEADRNHLSANAQVITVEKVKCEDCLESLKMINDMKVKEAVKAKILPKGDELVFEWYQGVQFKTEMLSAAEEGMDQTS
jgi:hypothetical protein